MRRLYVFSLLALFVVHAQCFIPFAESRMRNALRPSTNLGRKGEGNLCFPRAKTKEGAGRRVQWGFKGVAAGPRHMDGISRGFRLRLFAGDALANPGIGDAKPVALAAASEGAGSDRRKEETPKRTLARTLGYRLLATFITAVWTGLGQAVFIHVVLAIMHYFYERIWLKIQWGIE
jgi:hypothetical protein